MQPYQCNICEKIHMVNIDLTKHMWRHAGEKPYQGRNFDKAFHKIYIFQYTKGHTLERNLRKSVTGTKLSDWNILFYSVWRYTLVRYHIRTVNVTVFFQIVVILKSMLGITLGRNLMSVTNVLKIYLITVILWDIWEHRS